MLVPGSTSLASAQLLRAVRQASGARQTHLTFKDSEFISLMLILQAAHMPLALPVIAHGNPLAATSRRAKRHYDSRADLP